MTSDPRPQSIVVYVGGHPDNAIGENLIKMPFLVALRELYPDARLTWIPGVGPAQFDGILKQAATNVVPVGQNPLNKTIFRDMLKAMPTEFLRNKKRMRFLVSVDAELDYRDTTASRESGVGDRYLESDVPVMYSGVPIIDVPLFPETQGAGNNESNALLTDPKNINVGIWRRVKMETDKDISAGVLIIVATLRFDTKFAEERATVKGTEITVS